MLRLSTTITEILMLLYWVLAAALVFDLISIDPALMYSDYENPLVVAWNWSFFPIDIAFAVTGLSARFGSVSGPLKFKLEIVSALLMFCAGLMAVSFWTLTGDFDATWWGMNVWLMLLGMVNLSCARLERPEPGKVQAL